jgi:hypothetical protein
MNLQVGVKGLVGEGTKEYEVVPDGRARFADSCQGPAPWCPLLHLPVVRRIQCIQINLTAWDQPADCRIRANRLKNLQIGGFASISLAAHLPL